MLWLRPLDNPSLLPPPNGPGDWELPPTALSSVLKSSTLQGMHPALALGTADNKSSFSSLRLFKCLETDVMAPAFTPSSCILGVYLHPSIPLWASWFWAPSFRKDGLEADSLLFCKGAAPHFHIENHTIVGGDTH